MHQKRLEKALSKYLESFANIRLWTFTLSNKVATDPVEHAKTLSKCWKYFITEARRSNLLTVSERQFQYVKFSEPHQSGYFHYHAFFDRYIHWYKIKALWRSAVETVTGAQTDVGHCHVSGRDARGHGKKRAPRDAARAAKYVAKYVVKSSKKAHAHMKLWTKSSRVALFEPKVSSGDYIIHHELSNIWVGLRESTALTCSHFDHLHKNAAGKWVGEEYVFRVITPDLPEIE